MMKYAERGEIVRLDAAAARRLPPSLKPAAIAKPAARTRTAADPTSCVAPPSQYRLAERRADELDCQASRRKAVIERGIHFDELERVGDAALSDDLHCQMRLAIRDSADDRRARARSGRRVDDVDVEAHVRARWAVPGDRDRALYHARHARTIDIGHRVTRHAALAQRVALSRIDVAESDEHASRRIDQRHWELRRAELRAHLAEGRTHAHPMDVAGRARRRRVHVRVRVEPDDAARSLRARDSAERPDRQRMVAADDETVRTRTQRALDGIRQRDLGLSNRLEMSRRNVVGLSASLRADGHVAKIVNGMAERLECLH